MATPPDRVPFLCTGSRAYTALENRIRASTSLPIDSLDRLRLQAKLEAVGKDTDPADA